MVIARALRFLRLTITAIAAVTLSAFAYAQSYPTKPIRLISPWPAGGPAEAIARPVVDQLSQRLGQPVVIETKPGANGMIATAYVAQSPPDGYTLLLSHAGPTAISPALVRDMPYDPIKDFEHITLVSSITLVLLVRPELPVNTVPELIAYAKANPGKLAYGSVGPGSTTHLAAEMFAMMSNTQLLHVPYKGASPMMVDLLGGRIQVAVIGNSAAEPHVKAGKLRRIAVASSKERLSILPDVPTVHETLPGYEVNSWYGLAAPAGTPKGILARLYAETAKALRDPDVVAKLRATGSEPSGIPPEEFLTKIKADIASWAKVVPAAGLAKQ